METLASSPTHQLGFPAVTPALPILIGGDDGPGEDDAADKIEVGKTQPDEDFPVVFFGKKNYTGTPVALPRSFVEDDLRHIGRGWDGWSSVKILQGHKVDLWPNKQFNGGKTEVTESMGVLPGSIREDMGSLRVISPERKPESPSKGEGGEEEKQQPAAAKRPKKKRLNTAGLGTSNLAMIFGGLGLAGAAVYYVQQSRS